MPIITFKAKMQQILNNNKEEDSGKKRIWRGKGRQKDEKEDIA